MSLVASRSLQQPAWLALYLACARLGAIAVAVNTRFRSSEIADILGRSGARLLVLCALRAVAMDTWRTAVAAA